MLPAPQRARSNLDCICRNCKISGDLKPAQVLSRRPARTKKSAPATWAGARGGGATTDGGVSAAAFDQLVVDPDFPVVWLPEPVDPDELLSLPEVPPLWPSL